MENAIENIKSKAGFIIDMDGVIYHGNKLLPGVTEFLAWLEEFRKKISLSHKFTVKELQRNCRKS